MGDNEEKVNEVTTTTAETANILKPGSAAPPLQSLSVQKKKNKVNDEVEIPTLEVC